MRSDTTAMMSTVQNTHADEPTKHTPIAAHSGQAEMGGRLGTALILLLLFLAAWIPRTAALDTFVTADERKWLVRSANFTQALSSGDLYHTFQREHPGVTTTWLGSLGVAQLLPDYAERSPGYFDPNAGEFEEWLTANTSVTPLAVLARGRFWTVLVVALVLAFAYFPLRQLFGVLPAVVASLFVAWAPMTVAYTQQLHPDGLEAAFMYGSLLYFLSFLYGGLRTRDLMGAGFLMGLGWLTKTPVLFLVPVGALLVAIELWRSRRAPTEVRHKTWKALLAGYGAWGIIASVVFLALWPAMWVDPLGIFRKMYVEMTAYVGGHIHGNFFMGKTVEDPGPLFYPVAYLFRTTPATLLGLATAVFAAIRFWPPFDRPAGRRAGSGLLIFAVLFGIFMTFVAKKFDRYLLPTFFVGEVLAGIGWAALALWIGRRLAGGSLHHLRKLILVALVVLLGLIPLHAWLTGQSYPYSISYFNPLTGGGSTAPRVLFVGWGEGLDQVGRWLEEQPNPANLRVISWYSDGPLGYFFSGQAIDVQPGSRMPWLDVDYVVTYINQVQRDIPTRAALDFFDRQQPVFTAKINGMDMAKVYHLRTIMDLLAASTRPPVDLPAGWQWPGLMLSELQTVQVAPAGSTMPVKLRWTGNSERDLKVSLRLISDDDTLVAQQDRSLGDELQFTLFVPPDAKPGPYGLHLMLYEAETLEPVSSEDGQQIIEIAPVEIYLH